jgi:hypothetical protein
VDPVGGFKPAFEDPLRCKANARESGEAFMHLNA